MWTDKTLYSLGDKERVPTTWSIKRSGLTITVTKAHIYAPGEWVLHCKPWYDTHAIGPADVLTDKDAQREAVLMVLAKLRKAKEGFDDVALAMQKGE